MKLATLKCKDNRDGLLVLVDRTLQKAINVSEIAPSLQYALEHWHLVEQPLKARYDALNDGQLDDGMLEFSSLELVSPLPRAYQWLDGSAYLPHVRRVRQARGAEMPPSFYTDPLMYQGNSDTFLGPHDPILVQDEAWGIDCEAEVAVITDDVPMGVTPEAASQHIKLIMLVNDVSLRNLIPNELAKGFGFLQSKPSSAFSPVAITPDELGDAWDGHTIHLPLTTKLNDSLLGQPNVGVDMQFNFSQLIAHAAKTRFLTAGTIIGSGTISNEDESVGCSCLAEKRVLEIIHEGAAKTPFLSFGDTVSIEMHDHAGSSIFGEIKQSVKQYHG